MSEKIFQVGQEGEFTILDAFGRPIQRIWGRILTLSGKQVTYAFLRTESGFITGRLA